MRVFAGPEWQNDGARRLGSPHQAQRPAREKLGLRFSHSTIQHSKCLDFGLWRDKPSSCSRNPARSSKRACQSSAVQPS